VERKTQIADREEKSGIEKLAADGIGRN